MPKPILIVSAAWTGAASAIPAAATTAASDFVNEPKGLFFPNDFM